MKKYFLFLVLSLFLVSNVWSATGWIKGKPAAGDNPGTIFTTIGENNSALDLMLSNFTNCKISYTSATTISVSAGGVMVSNVGGTVRLMLANAAATAVTFTDIDTGAEAASTTYYVYAIGSATTDTVFTCKISTSSSAPTGITYYKRLGSFYNDASSNITTVIDDFDNNTQVLGTWVSKSTETVYLAATDGFVVGYRSANGIIYGYTDASNPPTTKRWGQTVQDGYSTTSSICMPVKKGNYWKTDGATGALFWIPLQKEAI